MVKKKSIKKYTTKTGQNTGTSKNSKKVIKNADMTPRVQNSQNLNSGNLLANGLYNIYDLNDSSDDLNDFNDR